MHITVTLSPAAFGLPSHPEVPDPTFEFELDPPGQDDEDTCEIVFSITNSYEQEMFCDRRYAEIVKAYRGRSLRSLSVGDTVTLTDDAGSRTYRVASFGFEPATD